MRTRICYASAFAAEWSRWILKILLALMALLGATGIYMLYGTWRPWFFDVHRIAGWSLIALLPWKALIAFRALNRGLKKGSRWSPSVILSLALAAGTLTLVLLGVMWMWRIGPHRILAYQTALAAHWILGLAILPLLALHVWRRWPEPRRADLASRRGVLKLLALGAAGVIGWQVAEVIAQAQATEERPRRTTTGSRGCGLFQGNAFPTTGESTMQIDSADWRLTIEGSVRQPLTLNYDQMLLMAVEHTTDTLDCTNGWYTVQEWQGVALVDLLRQAGTPKRVVGVRLFSATGYNHTYLISEAKRMLLATHVGGEVLAPRHGYPLRAVVPDRRGWFWLKWVNRIEVLDDPLEVLAGVLSSPRETLRQF